MRALSLQTPSPVDPTGGRLVTVDGRALALKEVRLSADARGGLARVTLTQRFFNPYDEPLAVTYTLPLPHDGAVSGYAFTFGNTRVVGEVDRRAAARERFERALLEGRTAALLDQFEREHVQAATLTQAEQAANNATPSRENQAWLTPSFQSVNHSP